ncbi:MAG TPA: cytochrome b/b6 domain-containing protein [Burkholderiales bacterium]|jgi:thiosulfate reductase cytochrome b subunit|nr:cytochrome b/b6 domain-containing protein [Burkholderiales bacterium]
MADEKTGWVKVHPALVRICHWGNAIAIFLMVMSGWQIYNASPLFAFRFPKAITLGGWLGGAIQWHFAAMWLLVINGLLYLAYNVASGRLRMKFWPIRPGEVVHDMGEALRGKLSHADPTHYNAVQKLAYVGVMVLIAGVILSGLAIWKPVQFQVITELLGGYEIARRVHFICMALIVFFVAVHVVMVALVPKTFIAIITGRARAGIAEAA